MHIVDDYYLQGILASMKQKEWWRKQEAYEPRYKNDYKIALAMHSMSWSIMILLPSLFLFDLNPYLALGAFVLNAMVHCLVDDLKANRHKINLVTDQIIHLIQVFVTWMIIIV
jgi:hypothetical protein